MLGKKHTCGWKRKHSEMMSGKRNPFYGQKHTKESLMKMSLAKKGKPSPHKGNFYPNIQWNKNPVFTTGYRAYVRYFQRNGGQPICFECGKQGEFAINNIHIHHKDGDRHNNSMDNLQPLCSKCHLHIHKNWEKRKT